jgi:hypothetical protein
MGWDGMGWDGMDVAKCAPVLATLVQVHCPPIGCTLSDFMGHIPGPPRYFELSKTGIYKLAV